MKQLIWVHKEQGLALLTSPASYQMAQQIFVHRKKFYNLLEWSLYVFNKLLNTWF